MIKKIYTILMTTLLICNVGVLQAGDVLNDITHSNLKYFGLFGAAFATNKTLTSFLPTEENHLVHIGTNSGINFLKSDECYEEGEKTLATKLCFIRTKIDEVIDKNNWGRCNNN